MTRTANLVCGVLLLTCHPTAATAAQLPPSGTTPVTFTATIEAIDKANRTVTLKGDKGNRTEIKAPEQMEGFNSLRVGDRVTATYFEAIAVNVSKAGDPAPANYPTTITQRKDRVPGSETRRQQTFRVTVEALDPKASSLTVKDPAGRRVRLALQDAKQLQTLKAGDTVDVTYYESLLIKVDRTPK